ncbi:glutamate-cysteine ligase family protein [soil metagenome]
MTKPLSLFQGFGVELEYMIVNRETMDVLPVADSLLKGASGEGEFWAIRGDLCWSNEIVLHVIELKTDGPAGTLAGLGEKFQSSVTEINERLAPMNGCLMPTGVHPWMNPAAETRIWPHDFNAVYSAYDRVFNCSGHGWSNLQSAHLNLPYANDDEFGRLHAAIRLVLPILPAIAASSPVIDGHLSGFHDTRLDFYQQNQRRIPSIIGSVIPEPIFSIKDYEEQILGRIYQDIAPHDPDGILRGEFLNSRGAIARFSRNAIEIRLLDVQECPAADIAIIKAVCAIIRALVEEKFCTYGEQKRITAESLQPIFQECVRNGERAEITNREYLGLFGLGYESVMPAKEMWMHILDDAEVEWRGAGADEALTNILFRGTLASRMMRSLGEAPSRERIAEVYCELCSCLAGGRVFTGV